MKELQGTDPARTDRVNIWTGRKGTVFATGIPVSNSMTELYTMMRYLQRCADGKLICHRDEDFVPDLGGDYET